MTTAVTLSPRDRALLRLLSWTPATAALLVPVIASQHRQEPIQTTGEDVREDRDIFREGDLTFRLNIPELREEVRRPPFELRRLIGEGDDGLNDHILIRADGFLGRQAASSSPTFLPDESQQEFPLCRLEDAPLRDLEVHRDQQVLELRLQYFFERVLGLPSKSISSGLALGSAVHAGLAEYHRRLMQNEAINAEAVRKSFQDCWDERETEGTILFRDGDTP